MSTEDQIGTLIVVILKARNLNNRHTFYKQDVYAQATLNGISEKTEVVVRGGQHPEWDAELRFPVMRSCEDKYRKLDVACYDRDSKGDVLLGEGVVDISEALKKGEFDDWVPLSANSVSRGELYLELTFYSASAPPQTLPSVGLLAPPVKTGRIQRTSQRPYRLPNTYQSQVGYHDDVQNQHTSFHQLLYGNGVGQPPYPSDPAAHGRLPMSSAHSNTPNSVSPPRFGRVSPFPPTPTDSQRGSGSLGLVPATVMGTVPINGPHGLASVPSTLRPGRHPHGGPPLLNPAALSYQPITRPDVTRLEGRSQDFFSEGHSPPKIGPSSPPPPPPPPPLPHQEEQKPAHIPVNGQRPGEVQHSSTGYLTARHATLPSISFPIPQVSPPLPTTTEYPPVMANSSFQVPPRSSSYSPSPMSHSPPAASYTVNDLTQDIHYSPSISYPVGFSPPASPGRYLNDERPDPFLKRYQSPLPLPSDASSPPFSPHRLSPSPPRHPSCFEVPQQSSSHLTPSVPLHSFGPRHSHPSAPLPPNPLVSTRPLDPSVVQEQGQDYPYPESPFEASRLETLRLAEEKARLRHEQEVQDHELAVRLDSELNLTAMS